MRDDVKQLLALQDTDQKIQALESELVRIPQLQEAAKERLAKDTESLATAKSNFQANEIEIKNGSLEQFLMSLLKNLGREEITTASYLSKKLFSL